LIAVIESYQKDISSLFVEAKDKLVKIDEDAKLKKKDIVVNLAKDLEGKIPTDSICQKIVEELNGIVSRSLIQNCLPEDYKQGYRVKNARQQQQQQQQKNLQKEETKLALAVALNPEENKEVKIEEHQKNNGVVFTDVDGMSYLQWEKNDKKSSAISSNESNIVEDKSSSQSSNQLHKEQQQYLQRPSQLTAAATTTTNADKTIITEGTSFEYSNENNKDIIYFEFFIEHRDLENYLNLLKDHDKIWINGRINTRTKDITHYFGRLDQLNIAEKSSRNDTATALPTQ
jgi:hypothetical protein